MCHRAIILSNGQIIASGSPKEVISDKAAKTQYFGDEFNKINSSMKNYIEIKNIIKPFNKTMEVSGDKSISIRCVLLASQAIGVSRLYNLESEDVLNSLNSIKKLGIKFKKNFYEIYGYGINGYNLNKNIVINAGNSGTLARLILGLLVNSKKEVTIIGDKSLSRRDFTRVTDPLKLFGANIISNKGGLPVKIKGSEFLRPINYIEKLGSAQCKSSVMLAALKTLEQRL